MIERLSASEPLSPAEWFLHHGRYLFAAHFVRGRTVLDIACGTGYGSNLLATYGATTVTAVDISEDALDEGRRFHAHPNVEFVLGDVLDPPVTGPFGAVVSLETIEHIEHPERTLDVLAGCLDQDGVLVCSSPDRNITLPGGSRNDRPNNPFHAVELSRQELATALRERFHDVRIYRQLCRVPGHRFLAGRFPRVEGLLERTTAWPLRVPLPSVYVVAVARRPR
jgi:SAM-dependent methyltransferase